VIGLHETSSFCRNTGLVILYEINKLCGDNNNNNNTSICKVLQGHCKHAHAHVSRCNLSFALCQHSSEEDTMVCSESVKMINNQTGS